MKSYLYILLFLTLFTSIKTHAHTIDRTEFSPAFTHVVYFWLKNPDSIEDRQKFETSVKKFMHDSKYAKTRFVGTAPKATREVVDDSFTYSLILSFESAEAQAKYQAEPAHDVFVAECKELWKKVIVYDALPLVE